MINRKWKSQKLSKQAIKNGDKVVFINNLTYNDIFWLFSIINIHQTHKLKIVNNRVFAVYLFECKKITFEQHC